MKEVRSRRSRLLAVIAALALMLSMLLLNVAPAAAEDECLAYDEYSNCVLWLSDLNAGNFSKEAVELAS